MDHFTLPCALHIDTKGELDIPEGAEIVIGDDGQYVGFITEDGTQVPHRGFEENLASFVASEHADVQATPAAEAHAAEVGVDLAQVEGTGKDGTITKADVAAAAPAEGAASGEADSQQAG